MLFVTLNVLAQPKNINADQEPLEYIYRDYPAEWEQLDPRGRFMDRFLSISGSKTNPDKISGAKGVQNRFVENEMENPDFFFWGGHITQTSKRYYNMFCTAFVNTNDTNGHFSKQLCIPLNFGMLLEWVDDCCFENASELVLILIKKELGFDPERDIDLSSLRFGANDQDKYGRGARCTSGKATYEGLIATFNMADAKITKDELAPKMIGNDIEGKVIFGYTRVLWVDYEAPNFLPFAFHLKTII